MVVLLSASAVFAGSRMEKYALVLEEPSAAAELLAASGGKGAKRAALATAGAKAMRAQNQLREALVEKGVRVTGSNHMLANVMFVEALPDSEADLRGMPGVKSVEKVRKYRLRLNRALDLMNVGRAWTVVNGEQNAGAGIRIGILDTGIDITHPGLQDNTTGLPSGFPKCAQDKGECAYTNRKVIAARSYVSMLAGTDPASSRPDDVSPRDRVGHGTAVAMIAAGLRNTGPAATITGVAPRAFLGNYKVFGSPGVNDNFTFDDVLLQAVEDAFTDGMDMVVLSMGSPAVWGPNDRGATCERTDNSFCDFRVDAIENAARMNMLTVVAAGNSGLDATKYPSTGSIESPGTAPSAITVGGSTSNHIWFQTVRPNGSSVPSAIQAINARFGDGPKPGGPITAPLRSVAAVAGSGNALACNALPGESLTGAIALIQRGTCDIGVKINNAQRAGAIAAIIFNIQGAEDVPYLRGLGQTGIPSILIGNRNGTALQTWLAGAANATVTLDPAAREVSTTAVDMVAEFSSRGPSIRENAIKPEVLGVGTDLYVATQKYDPNGALYDATGYTAVEGTSFSAPMAAGIAAMVWQRNPQWTPAQVKSAVVNTADPRATEDYGPGFKKASVLDQGAGIMDANAAVRTTVTVVPSTLSFGVLSSNPNPSIPLSICNFGTSPTTLTLRVTPSGSQTSLVVLNTNTLNLQPNGCADRQITASLASNRANAGIYEGNVVITALDGTIIRLPYLYLAGDGVPFSVQPLRGTDFIQAPGSELPLLFKVVDKYGVPVSGLPVSFRVGTGNGSFKTVGPATDSLGIGYGTAILGNQIGTQEFFASAGSDSNFGVYFTGRALAAPSISSGGIVNAANGSQMLAPGSYISIFGSGLSEFTRSYGTSYLPLSLSGVSVSFDAPSRGLSYPGRISFISGNQINVQVPWELQGTSSIQVKVSIGEVSSALATASLQDYAPAAFEYNDGNRLLAAAQDSNFRLLSTSNPAVRNSVILLYANGVGPVNNQPASGDPSPSQPLATSKAIPTVTIGGRPAEVQFSGLTPPYVGLYQINVRVPGDAPTGLQPLVISSNGVESKASTLPVQ